MKPPCFRLVLSGFVSLLAALSVPAAESPSDWTQWRGAGRDGVSLGTAFPDSLAGLERVWRVPAGKGYPGPIVAADRVFVVESGVDEALVVRALDRATGAVRWEKRWSSSGEVPFFAAKNGDWVRSTPAYDGKTLFVGDMREVLRALDGETGEERWRLDLPAQFKTEPPMFGFASSPLVDGDALYVQAADSVLKLAKDTGAVLWRALARVPDETSSGAFSSPVLADLAGTRQLVVLTRLALHGLDPATGRVLWSQDVPNFRGTHVLTPVVVGDTVFTSPYNEGSFLFRIKQDGAAFAVETVWRNKASGYMSSPVVAVGHVFHHLGNGRLDCLELATGESRWRSDALGKYWSLVLRDDKILALAEDGALYLLRANPAAFTLLDKRQLADQETWGHLAVAGNEIFVRELEGVSAWRWKSAKTP